MTWRWAGLIALAALMGCRHVPVESTHYAVRASYPVPGPGRWDLLAVDPSSQRVFLTQGDRVQVLDSAGRVVGTLRGIEGAHGIAIAAHLRRGSSPTERRTR